MATARRLADSWSFWEKGDLITIREHGRRTKHTARLYDVLWWMLRFEADKAHMNKLRNMKARKANRLAELRQRKAERRLFRRVETRSGENGS